MSDLESLVQNVVRLLSVEYLLQILEVSGPTEIKAPQKLEPRTNNEVGRPISMFDNTICAQSLKRTYPHNTCTFQRRLQELVAAAILLQILFVVTQNNVSSRKQL